MELTFLGATGTVTGSKYLMNTGESKFLVDCGLFQGLKPLRLRNWEPLPIQPAQIKAVILTHAHIDHSGYLPLLVKQGFRGKIYASAATFELCQIMLPDSGHLQEEDAFFATKKGFSKHKPALPLYTEADAIKALEYFEVCEYEKEMRLDSQTSFKFLRAGHILGASMAHITHAGKTFLFSGDLGRSQDEVMFPPQTVDQADYLVLESTYGDRVHEKTNTRELLSDVINSTVKRGGSVIIPAFAVGRTQLLVYLIQQLKKSGQIPNVPVFLDSPMGVAATDIFLRHEKEHRLSAAECAEFEKGISYAHSVAESQHIDQLRFPLILISSSGMATGGRVIHHLKIFLPDPKNTVLLVGYQAEGTRGSDLLKGQAFVKIHGEMIPVKAQISSIENLSAHADSVEILDWLRQFKTPPQKIFVIHGEPSSRLALQKKIQDQLGWKVSVPDYLETIQF